MQGATGWRQVRRNSDNLKSKRTGAYLRGSISSSPSRGMPCSAAMMRARLGVFWLMMRWT